MPEFSFTWYATHWGYFALAISLVVVCILAGIYLKVSKPSHAWAAQTRGASEQKDAPLYALILPIVPVVLKIAFDFSVIGGFVIAGFAALFLCGRMKGSFKENCQLVNKLYYDGVVDYRPADRLPADPAHVQHLRQLRGPLFQGSARQLHAHQ